MAGRGDFQPYTPRWRSRATSASELLFWGVKVKVEVKVHVKVKVKVKVKSGQARSGQVRKSS